MKERLIAILHDIVPSIDEEAVQRLEGGGGLVGSGLIDSLTLVSLVTAIEQEFAIEFGPEDMAMDNFASLETLETVVRKRQG